MIKRSKLTELIQLTEWRLDAGHWMLDAGHWMLDAGYWMLGL